MHNTYVSGYICDVLHWLSLPQRIAFRVSALVWRSLSGLAPAYPRELGRFIQDLQGRRSLRSSAQGELLVLCANFYQTSTRFLCCCWPCGLERAPSILSPAV